MSRAAAREKPGRCGRAQGEQLGGELKAAVEELDGKKATFALATNELAQATRNLTGVLERCAKGE